MDQLKEGFRKMDQTAYKKRAPWSSGMENAYDRYKKYVKDFGKKHTAFENYMRETRRRCTPEQHLQRAQLAIGWGEAALKYVCFFSRLRSCRANLGSERVRHGSTSWSRTRTPTRSVVSWTMSGKERLPWAVPGMPSTKRGATMTVSNGKGLFAH